MIDQPQIIKADAQHAAVIRSVIPRSEIQSVMGPAMAEVMEVIAAQGIAPAGPRFSHHLRMDPETLDFEVGVPVAAPVAAAGRVEAGRLPAATVARTVYHGDYEGLGPAWGEFEAWITAAGHTPAPDLWECYVTDSGANPDPATWRTELNRPLTNVVS